jgi:excisionase family DNA binding protein
MSTKEIKEVVKESLDTYFGQVNDLHKKTLDVEELSKYLHLSPSYIRKLTSQGKIPFRKPFGKKLFFIKGEIDEHFRNSKRVFKDLDADKAADDYLSKNKFKG